MANPDGTLPTACCSLVSMPSSYDKPSADSSLPTVPAAHWLRPAPLGWTWPGGQGRAAHGALQAPFTRRHRQQAQHAFVP